MEITVKRIYFRDTYTIGAIQVNGKYLMDTLEPRAINWQTEQKTAGKTAIPEGRYRIGIAYSKTFKRKMPYLQNVPHFVGIMIHTGNTEKNTRGCILVGKAQAIRDKTTTPTEQPRGYITGEISRDNYRLTESRIHFNRLYAQIEEAIDSGEEVWVTVRSPREWTA